MPRRKKSIEEDKKEYGLTKKGEFRFRKNSCGFTWSDISEESKPPVLATWADVIKHAAETHRRRITGLLLAREQHENKRWHIHGSMILDKIMESKDSRVFDVEGVHPNIIKGGPYWNRYIIKDGDYLKEGEIEIAPPEERKSKRRRTDEPPWAGYARDKIDRIAYELDKQRAQLKAIEWPLQYKGINIPKPDPAVKKRHWYFWGPPTMSKTKEIQDICEGKKVFMVPADQKYRWENYEAQELCIMDDLPPISSAEWNEITETWRMERAICGGSRYFQRYWPLKVCRTFIVLSNDPPPTEASWAARFNVHYVDHHEEKRE